ncbi:ESF1 homolog [Lampris incognitus]|uniref:ESF1 homolog n=1 Tax=Lampris incognitus TaxID=2546036 RepID=UPI0024B588A6|nr:ESF1 homolog [Lampris incognitus]
MSSRMNPGGDDRFLRVQKDPRFWEMPEKESKIKIDKRFQAMFHDKRFKLKYTMDKRGRPINHSSTEDMKRFYNVSDSEEEDAESKKVVERKKNKNKAKGMLKGEIKAEKEPNKEKDTQDKDFKITGKQLIRGVRVVEADDNDDDDEQEEEHQSLDEVDEDNRVGDSSEEEEGEEEDGDVSDEVESGDEDDNEVSEAESHSDQDSSISESEEDSDSGPDLARGKGNVETSSDEDDEDEVDAILRHEEEEIEHDWGELCKDASRNDQVTMRLAVCNMDWDRIKAKDLLALFGSFKPNGGVILSVKIYPSEFGRERMHLEKTQGPLELRALPDDPEEDNEEQRVYREKMRDYQFKRLKYYYAVVECDSAETASKIYNECDGFEYESSCSIIDLRFVPDDVTFDEEPKDVASEVDLSAYTPKLFTSAATSTSKVELTWDETDHERVTALQRKFNKDEMLEMDFNAYLASSSEDEEEEEEEENGEELDMDGDKAEGQKKGETAEEEDKPRANEKKKKKKTTEQIAKYRELLKSIQEKEKRQQEDKDMEMEITWVPGLKETTEQLVKKKLEGKDEPTPWEGYLNKKKEKKKQKKAKRKQGATDSELSDDELPPDVDFNDPFFAEELGSSELKTRTKGKKNKKAEEVERTPEENEELEKQKAEIALLMEDEDDAQHKHFNYDQIVKEQNLSKKKKKKLLKKKDKHVEEDDFQVDVRDPRFQAMFTSHLFSLDPCDPNYKKTKGTQSFLAEKQRRREEEALGAQQAMPTQEAQNVGQETGLKKQEKAADSTNAAEASKRKAMDPSLSLLVKSIKNKTEKFQAQKKQRIA